MSESIEISATSAKRVPAGSAFGMNLVPLEFADTECWYEYPQFNVKVDFRAKWVFEKRATHRGDKIVERSIGVGMILIKDELGRLITRAIEEPRVTVDAQALVLDCYELIAAFLRARNEACSFSDRPRIYFTTPQEFGRFGDAAQVAPEALNEVSAVEVY
jgi:hypothetical protein